jgi:predicted  nucleic acid-binding Zn-ribbon protein
VLSSGSTYPAFRQEHKRTRMRFNAMKVDRKASNDLRFRTVNQRLKDYFEYLKAYFDSRAETDLARALQQYEERRNEPVR